MPVRPAKEQQPAQSGRYTKGHTPWNKGRVLTTRPHLETVRRWLEECVDEGFAERAGVRRTGKPGRPEVLYQATEKGAEWRRQHPSPPPEVARMQTRQLRRWENAKRRNRMQQATRKRNAAEKRLADAGRNLTAAEDAVKRTQARLDELNLAAEMVMHATGALLAAGQEAVASLHPQEVDALVEYKCATRTGDGVIALNPAWLDEYNRALDEEAISR